VSLSPLHAMAPGRSPLASSLPVAPARVVDAGLPRLGRYAGCAEVVDLSELQAPWARSALWRRFRHKRWQYVGMGSGELFVGIAIVDLGWAMTAFVYVFDRLRRRLLADWSADALPVWGGAVSNEPVRGMTATFRGNGAQVRLGHADDDVLVVHAAVPGINLQARLDMAGSPPFLLAVGPVEGGSVHTTHKSPGLPVSGWVAVEGERRALDGAVGCLDSSNGLLPRQTSWRWACAHDERMGFNLQAGYFGGHENALWLDGMLHPLGCAEFDFDPQNPLQEWRIHTDDGLLDLRFQPEGARQADRHLGLAASRYVQPVGTFHGTVRASVHEPWRMVEHLVGVTEDHDSLW